MTRVDKILRRIWQNSQQGSGIGIVLSIASFLRRRSLPLDRSCWPTSSHPGIVRPSHRCLQLLFGCDQQELPESTPALAAVEHSYIIMVKKVSRRRSSGNNGGPYRRELRSPSSASLSTTPGPSFSPSTIARSCTTLPT